MVKPSSHILTVLAVSAILLVAFRLRASFEKRPVALAVAGPKVEVAPERRAQDAGTVTAPPVPATAPAAPVSQQIEDGQRAIALSIADHLKLSDTRDLFISDYMSFIMQVRLVSIPGLGLEEAKRRIRDLQAGFETRVAVYLSQEQIDVLRVRLRSH